MAPLSVVLRQVVVALLALAVGAAAPPRADPRKADGPQPGRYQYLPVAPQDKLFDTATGRLHLYDDDEKRWFLYVREPRGLDAEAVKSPRPGRFQYLPRRPQDRLFDSATGRVYLLDTDERKWFLYIKEPKP